LHAFNLSELHKSSFHYANAQRQVELGHAWTKKLVLVKNKEITMAAVLEIELPDIKARLV
jgi:hypothetical protein